MRRIGPFGQLVPENLLESFTETDYRSVRQLPVDSVHYVDRRTSRQLSFPSQMQGPAIAIAHPYATHQQ